MRRIILEEDNLTKQTKVTEEDVTEDYAYASIACYLSERIKKDFPEDREQALIRLQQTFLAATEMTKEKYK